MLHLLSERLASPGIMGAQLRAPLKPPQYYRMLLCMEGFRGPLTEDRYTPVSRTAVRLIAVVFPAMDNGLTTPFIFLKWRNTIHLSEVA